MKRGNDVPTLLEYCSDRDIDIDDPRALIEVGDEEEDGAEIRLHTYDHYDPNRRESNSRWGNKGGRCSRRNSHKCLLLAIYYSCIPTVVMNQVDIPGLHAVQSHANMMHPSLIAQMIQSKCIPIIYLRGMKREEWVAPIPGLPCLTGRLF
ncbi:hypothetical protein EYC84_005348 [Monilinia fructicola]|uniref:Uncharacterized protein n=1 Tax=Monilinia fructicola TaxID=38448 RepID=A0A5M9K1C6_MONFR|nr:hypothetical protein EYC84_005348 [Monilinia fructicola]